MSIFQIENSMMKKSITSKELNKYQIKSIRADWWDYSSNGLYFITICTKNMQHFFGKIEEEEVVLNRIGKLQKEIGNKFQNISRTFLWGHLLSCLIIYME